jgi:hypothetical protein
MKSLQIARQLVKAGRPFAAHEVLEASLRRSDPWGG